MVEAGYKRWNWQREQGQSLGIKSNFDIKMIQEGVVLSIYDAKIDYLKVDLEGSKTCLWVLFVVKVKWAFVCVNVNHFRFVCFYWKYDLKTLCTRILTFLYPNIDGSSSVKIYI